MKTQNLIRYVIAAWLKKHITGGFYLTYRPSKDSEDKQTLFLSSNTKDAKLTIYDGIFHNDTIELRSEMAIAKAINIETARGSLADKWDILALERLYQQLYKVRDALNYLSVMYDGEKGDIEITVETEEGGLESARFNIRDHNMSPEFSEELLSMFNYNALIFKSNYPKIPEHLRLTKFESVLEFAIRGAIHDNGTGIVIEQHKDRWLINFFAKSDEGDINLLECTRSADEESGVFTVNGKEFTSDAFFDMLTFPASANKTQKLFYDVKSLITLLNSYRFAHSQIVIHNYDITNVIMTVDNYLTTGEMNVYTSEQYPNSYDEARVKDAIRKIVERKSPFTY